MNKIIPSLSALSCLLLAFTVTPLNAQVIVVENTASSGNISNTLSSGNFSFDAEGGNFLVVPLTISGGIGNLSVTGTYGLQNLTVVSTGFWQDTNGATTILYLSNPNTGSNTLSLSITTDDAGGDPMDGDWQFGAISLSNVDASDPFADVDEFNANGLTSKTLEGNPGAISAGDFLIWTRFGRNSIGDGWQTPTDGSTSLWNYQPPVSLPSGNGRIAAGYASLVLGDISNGDELVIDTSQTRVGANTTLILNAIPEPTTFSLLGLGLASVFLRRCRS